MAVDEQGELARRCGLGASQEQFKELADKAKTGCPVSKVLNATISLDATLIE